ncbi:hypothetical protein MGWOODY_Smn42 [hydrothermal vent metagenome]|uniref:Uncharacterized protein n=1 Tax=hydrothermal vent metagenome TaxID=652676 RepID=A0A160TMY2_9ZZZZ
MSVSPIATPSAAILPATRRIGGSSGSSARFRESKNQKRPSIDSL